jgi:hypothetical protein
VRETNAVGSGDPAALLCCLVSSCYCTCSCQTRVHCAAQMGGAAKFEDAKRPKPWIVQDPCGAGSEGAL